MVCPLLVPKIAELRQLRGTLIEISNLGNLSMGIDSTRRLLVIQPVAIRSRDRNRSRPCLCWQCKTFGDSYPQPNNLQLPKARAADDTSNAVVVLL
jgi:hypothetical protein